MLLIRKKRLTLNTQKDSIPANCLVNYVHFSVSLSILSIPLAPSTRAIFIWLFLWNCHTISEGCCKELQRLQNRAARIILRRKSSKNAFHLLNWLSLACRRKLRKCSLVFKCLNNLVPKYLTEYFIRNKAFHDYGTRRSNDLHPPKPNTNMGKRTFKYAGTIRFNFLPAYIKTAPSFSNFKVC